MLASKLEFDLPLEFNLFFRQTEHENLLHCIVWRRDSCYVLPGFARQAKTLSVQIHWISGLLNGRRRNIRSASVPVHNNWSGISNVRIAENLSTLLIKINNPNLKLLDLYKLSFFCIFYEIDESTPTKANAFLRIKEIEEKQVGYQCRNTEIPPFQMNET